MTVTIHPQDRDDARRLARRLLKAAGPDQHDEVRTTTGGAGGLAFDVPADLADRVFGLDNDPGRTEHSSGGLADPPTPDEP
ncbi:hypothetical protein, partial [Couchioplanes caeruleus]